MEKGTLADTAKMGNGGCGKERGRYHFLSLDLPNGFSYIGELRIL